MGRAKRLRIAELERLEKGEDAPSVLRKPEALERFFRCGKCKHWISESGVNDHLAECQPQGATCGKCKQLITDPDFVGHFRACLGKPKEEPKPVDIPENK